MAFRGSSAPSFAINTTRSHWTLPLISAAQVEQLYPDNLPDLFAGSQLVLTRAHIAKVGWQRSR